MLSGDRGWCTLSFHSYSVLHKLTVSPERSLYHHLAPSFLWLSPKEYLYVAQYPVGLIVTGLRPVENEFLLGYHYHSEVSSLSVAEAY